MNTHRPGLRLLAGLGVAAITTLAGLAQAKVDTMQFEALDLATLRAQDEARNAQMGEIDTFAVPNEVAISPLNRGTIEQLADGRMVWRFRIETPNALNINLGTLYDVPPSTQLYLVDQNGETPIRAFTADDNRDAGELWTPVVAGSSLEVYAEVDADEFDAFANGFQITHVNLGFERFGIGSAELDGDQAGGRATDACHIDVACSEADPWRGQVNSVGAYTIQGFGVCSGAMINTTARDGRPYFMTAYHCLDGFNFNVSSMVVYWNFQNSTCRPPGSAASGSNGDGTLSQFTFGGNLLMRNDNSDWALIELDNPPQASFGVTYAGWDRRSNAGSPGVGIHHPGVEEKRISIENGNPFFDTVFFQGQGNISTWGVSWNQGGVEQGSSGSPYFNQNGQVIGTATAASFQDICFGQFTFYGRMDIAWNGDGTPSTRLSDWLDPAGTGEFEIEGLGDSVAPPGDFDLLTPGNNSTVSNPPTFDWTDADDADEYRVRVTRVSNNNTVLDTNVTSSILTPSASLFDPGVEYQWLVIAENAAGTNPANQGVWRFTIEEPLPADFDLVSPADGATDVSLTPVLQWDASSPNITSYNVVLRETGSPTDLISTSVTGTSLDVANTALGSLDADTSYSWGVVAINSAGATASTPGLADFTTEPADCLEDLDGSGSVDGPDLVALLANFGSQTSDGDITGDGVVDGQDLVALLAVFGTPCP